MRFARDKTAVLVETLSKLGVFVCERPTANQQKTYGFGVLVYKIHRELFWTGSAHEQSSIYAYRNAAIPEF